MRALEARLTADSAVGPRVVQRAACAARHRSRDYAQLLRTVKRAGLLRRRPVYYSLKIGLNLVLLAAGWSGRAIAFTPGQIQGRHRLGVWLGRYQAPPLNRAMQKSPCGPRPQVGAY
jgi:hypothetical protein